MFRLCDDEGLVSAVTTPDKPPSLRDLEALEQCFQRGLLRCDDVPGQDCSQVEVCGEYAADWGACADPGKFLHCRDEKKTEGKYWACVGSGRRAVQRHVVVDRRHRVGRRLVPDLRLVRRRGQLVRHVGGELRALPGPVVRRRVIALLHVPSPRVLCSFPFSFF